MVGPGQNKGDSFHGLDRKLEPEVAFRALDSLFQVEVKPKHLLEEDSCNPITDKTYRRFAEPVETAENKQKVKCDAITYGTKERYSTGFAIARQGSTLRILTCAHTIADVFSMGKHAITAKEVNDTFRFDVHCIHHEDGIINMVSHRKLCKRKRTITPAWVVALDTKLDLLVLEVDVGDLAGNNEPRSTADHPLIQLARSNPNVLDKLILPGWPPQRSKALSVGQVSHSGWSYDAISSDNVKGYSMELLEIPGMAASNGFSGGPVVNGNCECVAVYHGVFDGMTGYGVSLQDIQAFLHKHKLLSHWDEEIEAEESSDEEIEAEESSDEETEEAEESSDEETEAEESNDEDSDYEISKKKKRTVKKRKTPLKKQKTLAKKQKTPLKKQKTPLKKQKTLVKKQKTGDVFK